MKHSLQGITFLLIVPLMYRKLNKKNEFKIFTPPPSPFKKLWLFYLLSQIHTHTCFCFYICSFQLQAITQKRQVHILRLVYRLSWIPVIREFLLLEKQQEVKKSLCGYGILQLTRYSSLFIFHNNHMPLKAMQLHSYIHVITTGILIIQNPLKNIWEHYGRNISYFLSIWAINLMRQRAKL